MHGGEAQQRPGQDGEERTESASQPIDAQDPGQAKERTLNPCGSEDRQRRQFKQADGQKPGASPG